VEVANPRPPGRDYTFEAEHAHLLLSKIISKTSAAAIRLEAAPAEFADSIGKITPIGATI
jgi:hypothetical protein